MEQLSINLPSKKEEMSAFVKEFLEQARKQANPDQEEMVLSLDEIKDRLFEAKNNYEQKIDFKIGDIVEWKPRLKNRRFPKYGQVGIVMELLKQNVFDDEKNSGSPRFKEPLNIKIGIIDSFGEFEIFHYDKNRFKLHK